MERRRIASWWITWEDLNWPDYDSLDKVKARAEGLAKASVNTAMIFGTHFRWDWMPFFPLLHNYIATVAEELHKYDIKLYDHHSVNLVHRYSTQEEMLHVMRDSGPHLPFSPTWEAAASWEYKGKRLNDWRMIDTETGSPLYLPQYTAEGFCPRNPEFKEAYQDYAKSLIRETGIDGLSADDAIYYMHHRACACPYCKAEFKSRTGIDLPPVTDLDFWGNWENPAWHQWIDMRFDASGSFYQELGAALPKDFILTGCGGKSSGARTVMSASDARQFLRGCNYVNLELSGNTPPYKHDPKTVNVPLRERLSNSSHHQAAARERGVYAFSTAYAHSTASANIAWALSKILDADAWIGTLKGRLGLPRHILNTLPEEKDIVGEAFGFEKEHPDLFRGNFVGQLGVYFSYETRNHTMYGSLQNGYAKDYSDTLALLFKEGICPHTVFEFPKDTKSYPLILLSGVAKMTEQEISAAQSYLKAGGKIIAIGPCALSGCNCDLKMPEKMALPAKDFLTFVPPGESWIQRPKWFNQKLPPTNSPNTWSEPQKNLYYHPQRIDEKENNQKVLALCRKYMNPMPISIEEAHGYLCTMFEADDQYIVHFLCEDYNVDIDHELDSIRFHRSRVNLLTKIEPIGIEGFLKIQSPIQPTIYTPFNQECATLKQEGDDFIIQLPEKCAYAILTFSK